MRAKLQGRIFTAKSGGAQAVTSGQNGHKKHNRQQKRRIRGQQRKRGEQIKNMVEKIFKAGEGNYPEKLHKEAETKPLSKTLAKGTTAANLAELENAIDLQIAQIYYTQRMADGFTAKLKEAEEQLSKAKLGDYGAAAAEAACNKLDGEQKCNADPKCTYNSTEPDKSKKCKYNATKAEKNCVHVAQTQTAGTETTTGNCKGKEKDECKSPDCKWEGETCKDSTILLSKQFALSMVSSAFVALLF